MKKWLATLDPRVVVVVVVVAAAAVGVVVVAVAAAVVAAAAEALLDIQLQRVLKRSCYFAIHIVNLSSNTKYSAEHFTSAHSTPSHILRPRVNDVKYASVSLQLHVVV
jgi:hypothetical protein